MLRLKDRWSYFQLGQKAAGSTQPLIGSSDSKESASLEGDPGLIPGLGRSPGEGNGYPFQYFLLGKSHGQRSLVDYRLWGCKELYMTEWLRYILIVRPLQVKAINLKYWGTQCL